MKFIKSIVEFIKNLFTKKSPEIEQPIVVDREEVKIIGVGGFGTRAINYLKEKNFDEDNLFLMDTDSIDLQQSNKYNLQYLQIGEKITKGNGSGTNSKIGEIAAIENYDKISSIIKNFKNLILILSSGGATGTGAAPIIAKIAKENNVSTTAIVTTSFVLNNKRRRENKNFCIENLQKYSDEVITIAESELIDLEKIDRKFSFTELINLTNEKIYQIVNTLMSTKNRKLNFS